MALMNSRRRPIQRRKEEKMAQIFLLGAVGLVAWYGYRSFVREAERVSAKVRREEAELQNRAHGTLVQDPETGEYRIKKD